MKSTSSPRYYAFLAIVSFCMVVLSFTGIFMKAEITGRLIMGFAWSVVFIGWIMQLINARKRIDSDAP